MDRTLAQIAPEALAIIRSVGYDVEPGLRDDGSKAPNFRGFDNNFWITLQQSDIDAYDDLIEICRGDFPTFCALLLRVASKGGGGVHPFIFNNSQRLIWNRMSKLRLELKPLFLVILKARQLGITTFMSAWQYWQLWRQRDIQTLMIGHEVKLAERIVGIMRVFHDELPDSENLFMSDLGHLKPGLRAETKSKTARLPRGELYFADRRSWGITAVAKNIDQRGFQGTHFSGSEAAFWPSLNDLMDALLPQLPVPGTPAYLSASVVLESSPNGQNEFYDKYQQALDPETEWEPIFLPWMVQDDEYTMKPPPHWHMTEEEKNLQARLSLERRKIDGKDVTREQMYYRHYMLKNKYDNAIEAWDQEYPSNETDCFMLSSEVLFQRSMKMFTESVQEAEQLATRYWASVSVKTVGPVRGELHFAPLSSPFERSSVHRFGKPEFRANRSGRLLVWEGPKNGHHYTCGGDAAGGFNERDNAVAQLINVSEHRQHAEWVAPVGPEEFTDNMVNLCAWYNNALAMPEVNGGYGGAVLKRMMQEWGYSNIGREEKWDEVGLKEKKYGFSTQPNTKPGLISYMKWILEEGFLLIASRDLLAELSTFQFDGYSARGEAMYSARSKRHDDRVMGLALALYAVKQSPKLRMILEGEQMVPSARDLGLNSSVQVLDRSDDLPPQLRNIMGMSDDDIKFLSASNPIRGAWA